MTAIVVIRSAKMPASCKGNYKKIYVVDIDYWMAWDNWVPPQVRQGAKHINHIVWDSGAQNVGKTSRCAFQRALTRAHEIVEQYNNVHDIADAEALIGAGGSA